MTVRGAVASDARCSPRKRSRSRRRRWHNSQGDTVEEACREVTERGARRTCHSPVATVPSPTDTVSYSSIVEAVVYATVAEQFKRTGKPLSDQFFAVAFGNGDHTDWSKWCGPIIHSLYNLCTNPAGAEIVGRREFD